jgi:hypothetical protein
MACGGVAAVCVTAVTALSAAQPICAILQGRWYQRQQGEPGKSHDSEPKPLKCLSHHP